MPSESLNLVYLKVCFNQQSAISDLCLASAPTLQSKCSIFLSTFTELQQSDNNSWASSREKRQGASFDSNNRTTTSHAAFVPQTHCKGTTGTRTDADATTCSKHFTVWTWILNKSYTTCILHFYELHPSAYPDSTRENYAPLVSVPILN